MTRKRGKLSKGEMDYIRQNCFDLSLDEIADNIERTVETVKKFIDKENLKARNMTDDEHLLVHLRGRYYYHELKKQFSDGEIIFFEHQWIDYFKQFKKNSWTIEWDCEVDFAPEFLYRLTERTKG